MYRFNFPIIEHMQKSKLDLLLFENRALEIQYTKSALINKLGLKNKVNHNSQQRQACYHFWKNTQANVQFVKEWLDLCCEYENIVDVSKDEFENQVKGFIEHK